LASFLQIPLASIRFCLLIAFGITLHHSFSIKKELYETNAMVIFGPGRISGYGNSVDSLSKGYFRLRQRSASWPVKIEGLSTMATITMMMTMIIMIPLIAIFGIP
jgi:hypothetical protein